MDRATAIDVLARHDLLRLSEEERSEQLAVMRPEDWSEDPRWQALPADVRDELTGGRLAEPPGSTRYDAVLLIWLTSRYAAAATEFLLARLRADSGAAPATLIGHPLVLEPCPCCGRRTIAKRSSYEICPVCWWEDDGEDNAQAGPPWGSPNGLVSLTEGRINFLVHGIFDPARDDLREHQDPPEMYEVGRRFTLVGSGEYVSEASAGWTGARRRIEISGT